MNTIPQGFFLYTGNYNPEKFEKNNLLAIASDVEVFCAAMFTKNTCCGAPITVAKQKLQKTKNPEISTNLDAGYSGYIRGIIINTNISNVATGERGIRDAERECELLAESMKVDSQKILASSTGCIGPYLPMNFLEKSIPKLVFGKKQDLKSAANAIMTTDTKEKFISLKCGNATISGIAKGSGMIAPNMATMLAYIMTDANIPEKKFQKIWKECVEESFNMVSVDNCESTSDTAIAMMNPVHEVEFSEFKKCVKKICNFLAKSIAYDGEGATKGIEVQVTGADSEISAQKIALQIVSSDLVKTAIFGKDLNWGRIMGAAGSTHIPINLSTLSCSVGGVLVFESGKPVPEISEETELSAFENDEIIIKFNMNSEISGFSATAWGCDLTYEYVKINGEYRT